MIVVDLIYDLSVLVIISVLSGFLDQRFNRSGKPGKIFQGILFGTVAIIGMIHPFVFAEGIIFDGRSIIIGLCTLFFGPLSGGIAALMSVLYRLHIGGGGVLMGVLVIFFSYALGYLFFLRKNSSKEKLITYKELYLFGLLLHAVMLFLVLTLPLGNIKEIYKVISFTLLALFPLVTLLLGKILLDQENSNRFVNELKISEKKYRDLFESNKDGITIFYINPDSTISNIVEANEAAAIMLGFNREDIVGKHPAEFEIDRNATELDSRKREILEKGYSAFETSLKHKDGHLVPVEIKVVNLLYGNRPALMNIVRDISDRLQKTEELKKNEYYLTKAQEIGSIGTWEMDVVENILTWTEENYKIFGVPFGTPMNYELFVSCLHPEDREYVDKMWNEAVNGAPYDIEHRLIVDGKVKWVREKAELEFDAEGNALKGIGFTQDITERKELFERLKENEERFRLLFDQAPLGYQSLDENGCFIAVNKVWLEMLGYNYQDVIGKSFGDFFSPDYRNGFRERFASFKAAGRIHTEIEVVHKDGSYHHIVFEGRVGYNVDGSFRQTHCILSDETEKRKAALALAESEEKHKQMISNISDVIGITSAEGIIKYKSPNSEKWFGWKPEDLIGTNGWDTVHPEDLERIQKEFFDLLQEDNKTKKVVYRYKCKDGSYKPIELTAVNLTKNSAINGVLMNYRDITERKQTEEALRESEVRFRNLFEKNNAVMLIVEPKTGKIKDANASAAVFYGYSIDELKNKTIQEINTLAPEKTEEERSKAEAGQQNYFVFPHKLASGEIRTVEVHSSPITFHQEILLVSIIHDVTERKKAEAALRESEYFFKESQRAAFIGSYKVDFITGLWESSEVLDQIFGIEKEEVRSIERWLDIVHPIDSEMMNIYLTEEVIGKHQLFNKEYRILRKSDGATRWVHGLGKIDFDGSGNVVSMIGTIWDITEGKLAQDELNRKAEQFKLITETSNEGFWRVDLIGNLKEVNDIYCKMSGYSRDELLCMNISDLEAIERKEDTKNHMQKLLKVGFDKFETQHKCKDGKIVEMEVSSTYSKNLEMIMVFFTDITERKKVEKELKEQMEEITRFNKLMVGRENKMIELKKEINALLEEEGKPSKYNIH
ncbi:MAG: PAS domain S-box protein [Bacteroidetes bacterium]|nr:PAS domain S-box protein [Bacteroidota bacterium]